MTNVAISKDLEREVFSRMTIRQHRIHLNQRLLEPITSPDRQELVQMVTSIVGRLAVHYQGDAK